MPDQEKKASAPSPSDGDFITVEQEVSVSEIIELDPSRLAQVPQDALALFVQGGKDPIIIRNPKQIILGRATPDGPAPTIDLTSYGAFGKGVSRLHAKILFVKGAYFLLDAGSTNGTRLNGIRLAPGREYVLRPTDHIQLGKLNLRAFFQIAQPTGAAQRVVLRPKELPGISPAPVDALTPQYLLEAVGPFLVALAEIQHIINQILELPPSEVLVQSIELPPLTVSLTGVSQSIELVKTKIGPWETAHAGDIARLLLAEEAAKSEGKPKKEGILSTVTQPKVDESGSLEAKLEQAQMSLAVDLVAQIGPKLPEEKKKDFAQQLLPHLKTLTLSRITFFVTDTRLIASPKVV